MAETRAPIVFSFQGFAQLDKAINKLETLKKVLVSVNKLSNGKTGGATTTTLDTNRQQQLTAQSNQLNKVEKIRTRINDLDVKGTKLAALKGKLTQAESAIKKGDLPLAKQILAASEKRITILNRESKINKQNTKELENQRKSIEQATKSIRRRKIADKRRVTEESPGFRLAQFRRNRTAQDKRIRRDALSSAAIGGAFPLLFGQGPLAAVGGAAGGFAGGILGGQAGFALSLVGTQIGSAISQLVSGAAELGKALGPFTQDVQAVTTALGLQGSVQEARINKIEELKGKTAAFIAAQKIMSAEIGQRGVDALKKFGESTRILGSQFALALTKLQALTAGFLNFINTITGINKVLEQADANRVVKAEAALGDTEAQDLQNRQDAINEKTRGVNAFINPLSPTESIELSLKQKELDIEKKLFAIRKNTQVEADNLTQKFDALGVSIKAEAEETQRIAELRKQGLNPALAKSIAGIEKEGQLAKDNLQLEIDKIRQKLTATEELTDKDQVRLEELVKAKQAIDGQVDSLSEAAEATDKLNESIKDLKSNFEIIGQSIASGVTDNITAAIQGTKSLGDAAKSILNDLSSTLIKLGVNTLFAKVPGFGGLPRLLPFADGGRPPVGRPSLVGEKGPELFVPKRSGTIIPNDKLGGGSTNISVNVDASGSSVQGDEQQGKELGRLISVAIQSELLKQKRPGGLLR